MQIKTTIGLLACFSAPSILAQAPSDRGPSATVPVSQVQEYESSSEEYTALKERAHGGTRHTPGTLPDWRGVWRRQFRAPAFS